MIPRKVHIALKPSPHIHSGQDVVVIMRNVVLALLPLNLWFIWQFGLSAIVHTLGILLSCLLTERIWAWAAGKPNPLGDWSATITALLLALTVPPSLPLWMGAVGGIVAIALGKAFFGGLGFNVFNPALVGRAFIQAAFPVAVNTWPPAWWEGRFATFYPTTFTVPFMSPPDLNAWLASMVDAVSGATPLAQMKFAHQQQSALDLWVFADASNVTGPPALLILACGLYLAFRRMLDWRIPLSIMASAAAFAAIFWLLDPGRHPDPLFVLASGGLMLGAWFMATDMVGSPVTPLGAVLYGILIGMVTVIIRLFGGMAEGVMYAILLGNAATPLIERITQPRPFGAEGRRRRT